MSGMPRHWRGLQEHPQSRVEAKEEVIAMPAIRVSRETENSYTDPLLKPEHQIEQVKSRGCAPAAPNRPHQLWIRVAH